MVAPSNGPTATDFPIELKVPSLDRGDLSGGASYSDEEALLWHGAPDETIEYIRSSGFNPVEGDRVNSMPFYKREGGGPARFMWIGGESQCAWYLGPSKDKGDAKGYLKLEGAVVLPHLGCGTWCEYIAQSWKANKGIRVSEVPEDAVPKPPKVGQNDVLLNTLFEL